MNGTIFHRSGWYRLALSGLLGVLAGCATSGQDRWHALHSTGAEQYASVLKHAKDASPRPISAERQAGSLWQNSYNSRLYDNMYRASKVGDTVMIVVAEEAKASGSGKTKTNRKSEQSASIDHLGGLMEKLGGIFSALNPAKLIQAKTESKFAGDGSTSREGKLSAQLAATVTQLFPNGNMALRGEQHIKMNNEEQVLIVEGVVRPYDIAPNNTVPSTAVADARISFRGFGIIAERQQPGWLTRALDYVWPF